MQFFDNVSVFSMAQLKKTGAAGGTDFFEMNLPHCLLANVVKTEMEAVGSHIQVKYFPYILFKFFGGPECVCHSFVYVTHLRF